MVWPQPCSKVLSLPRRRPSTPGRQAVVPSGGPSLKETCPVHRKGYPELEIMLRSVSGNDPHQNPPIDVVGRNCALEHRSGRDIAEEKRQTNSQFDRILLEDGEAFDIVRNTERHNGAPQRGVCGIHGEQGVPRGPTDSASGVRGRQWGSWGARGP